MNCAAAGAVMEVVEEVEDVEEVDEETVPELYPGGIHFGIPFAGSALVGWLPILTDPVLVEMV